MKLKYKGISVHTAQKDTKRDCSAYEKVFMMVTDDKQLPPNTPLTGVFYDLCSWQ